MSDFYEYRSNPIHDDVPGDEHHAWDEHYAIDREIMRQDFERGVLERADAEDRERFEAALGQPERKPGPGERFSQFDTVEEDRGER